MILRSVTIILAVAGICLLSCKNEEILPKEKIAGWDETVVKTAQVESFGEANQISSIGLIISETEARPSFKTGGVINRTYAKEGDFVKKGQLLATLMMDEINAQVQQAEEGLFKAERDMKRLKNLFADSVATLEQLQNATTAFEVSKRSVEIAKFNKNYSEVRAPISGKIVKQILKSGEITGPGTPVYVIMGVGSQDWKVYAGLIDRDWARVKIKDHVQIRLDAYPGKVFEGFVSDKSSVGGKASGTFDIEITFKNQPQSLAAGLTAHVFINTKSEGDLLTIPIEALVRTNGYQAEVFTIKDGKAQKLNLQIARILGDRVAIASGLEGVDEVVTTGAIYLEEGEKIRK